MIRIKQTLGVICLLLVFILALPLIIFEAQFEMIKAFCKTFKKYCELIWAK